MERKIITAIFVFVSLFAPMQNDQDTSTKSVRESKEITIISEEALKQDFPR
jgi:hypothetical protein